MIFTECPIAGAWLVELERSADDRGFFARTHCVTEFAARGLNPEFRQSSISFNRRRGTLRGMHYQASPHAEAKLVRCTAGAVFDVIVDLRPSSPTCRRWYGADLTGANRRALYIPEGVAHGFISLTDDTEILYMISVDYVADAARGFRWDDPAIGIQWPLLPTTISARDAGFAALDQATVR
ncbi:MAG: dTDP-4-dehydrorhamnose 3,5-epimerase [Steroidobacterales bacterium]